MAEVRRRYRTIGDPVLQGALANLQHRLGPAAAAAYQALPEGPALRQRAHAIRAKAIADLDVLLAELADRITRRGGHVFFAADAAEAVAYCLETARRHRVKLAVKGKSMVTEEIGLNAALTAAGIETVETDLGEYIVQLAGEHPSHIIAPAIHKTRAEIGRLFAAKLNIPLTDDPPTLTRAARRALRKKFLTADMGITGVNLACAATGHIALLSNEGNIRMATTLPRVHVAFMGMERIAAQLTDHDILLRLLARGAAAQKMAGYISYIGGPRQPGHTDGPESFHLVIVDNGRSRILADRTFREILYCIRCAACLNVCPVYAKIGGHAYGSAYSGPLGAVLTPLMKGIRRASDLCLGESLCGACRAACPVDIDIPRMLLALRSCLAEGDRYWQIRPLNPLAGRLCDIWSWIVSDRRRYDAALACARFCQLLLPRKNGMLHRLPPPFSGWTSSRDLEPLARRPFLRRCSRQPRRHREAPESGADRNRS